MISAALGQPSPHCSRAFPVGSFPSAAPPRLAQRKLQGRCGILSRSLLRVPVRRESLNDQARRVGARRFQRWRGATAERVILWQGLRDLWAFLLKDSECSHRHPPSQVTPTLLRLHSNGHKQPGGLEGTGLWIRKPGPRPALSLTQRVTGYS